MLTALPENVLSSTALDPEDLAFMQVAFDQVVAARAAENHETRSAIASAILQAYMQGERDHLALIKRGMEVVG